MRQGRVPEEMPASLPPEDYKSILKISPAVSPFQAAPRFEIDFIKARCTSHGNSRDRSIISSGAVAISLRSGTKIPFSASGFKKIAPAKRPRRD
jgi:hypothetical protein